MERADSPMEKMSITMEIGLMTKNKELVSIPSQVVSIMALGCIIVVKERAV